MDQTNLLENMVKFNNKSRPRSKEGKDKKRNTFDSVNSLYEGRELTLSAFKSGIFPKKHKEKGVHYVSFASFGFKYAIENIKS